MKAKNIILTLVVLLGSLASGAQTGTTPGKDNMLFMLRQKEHIAQAIKTIEDLKGGGQTTLNTGDVVLIVCGEAVTALTCYESTEWVRKIQQYPGVSLLACGLSLDKFGQSEKDLVPGVGYTRNGFIKAFELQKQGYLSVEL